MLLLWMLRVPGLFLLFPELLQLLHEIVGRLLVLEGMLLSQAAPRCCRLLPWSPNPWLVLLARESGG